MSGRYSKEQYRDDYSEQNETSVPAPFQFGGYDDTSLDTEYQSDDVQKLTVGSRGESTNVLTPNISVSETEPKTSDDCDDTRHLNPQSGDLNGAHTQSVEECERDDHEDYGMRVADAVQFCMIGATAPLNIKESLGDIVPVCVLS